MLELIRRNIYNTKQLFWAGIISFVTYNVVMAHWLQIEMEVFRELFRRSIGNMPNGG